MREHSSVFRQSGEVCLIWLHDIPHISYWAQRPLFALMLTSLSSHALAVTLPWLSCLVLCTNSPTKFTFSPPTHASCCIYLFLSLLLSSVLSCFILPYPANLMSLLSPRSLLQTPFLFCFLLHPPFPVNPPSLLLLWRSAMMQGQRARPCLITLIKHPMWYNDLAPNSTPSLAILSSTRFFPPVVQQAWVCWDSLQAQSSWCQVAFHGWLRGMCFSLYSIGSTPQSPAVPDMLTSLEVMSETSPSLPDLL